MSRPRLLDLFCGAGGCSVGYHRAGFDVVGVDIRPQPRYPFAFVQADALEYARDHGREFDAVHASPPCQAYTMMRWLGVNEAPDLVEPTRQLLTQTGRPYVIENVPGAPLESATVLCGSMFGLGTVLGGQFHQLRRHRGFEASFLLLAPACRHRGQPIGVYGTGGPYRLKTTADGRSGGRLTGTTAEWRLAMGIDWMNRKELSQAIPPAYTEFVGRQLLAVVEG